MVFLIKVDQPQYVRSVTTDSYQAAGRLCGKKISIETGMVMTKKGNETESVYTRKKKDKKAFRGRKTQIYDTIHFP